MKQQITTDNFNIRPVHPDDAPAINEIAAHPQVARTLLQLPSKELVQTQSLLQERQPGLHRLVAVIGSSVAGMVTLTQPQNPRRIHSGSLGIMIHPEHWRKGIGTALMTAILDLADNWLNLKRVELGVRPSHIAAIRLYEKYNFEPEGTRKLADFSDGRYQDQLIMARLHPESPQVQPTAAPQFPTRQDVVSVKVRPIQITDADDLHEIFTHPGVGYGTNQLPSQELPDTIEWLKQQNSSVYRYSAVAQREDGSSKIVGNLTMHQYKKPRLVHAAWFGMSVHPHYWGLGIGSRLLESALELADNWLGLKRVELEVHSDNLSAIHLYRKFNFEVEGTKRLYSFGAGRWADALFMARFTPGVE